MALRILLAVDYHRTLADETKDGFVVHRRVIEAVERFISLGHLFAVVTSGASRHVKGIEPIINRVYLALENGLIVVTPSGERIINVQEQWWRLRELVKGRLISLGIRVSEGEASLFTRNSPDLIEALRDFNVRIEVNRDMASIMPSGVDKGYAIRVLREITKPDYVIAIGDAENDKPMLRAADVAVAVNNALPEVKEVAHYVTKGNDGDGVIEVINAILEHGVDWLKHLRC